ncbi:MAG TPA: hypothetical protein DCL21_06415 [Alphaproteobacteria bacterium]|nr:hypothetical protein [Alphaproteobacteria bacterium]
MYNLTGITRLQSVSLEKLIEITNTYGYLVCDDFSELKAKVYRKIHGEPPKYYETEAYMFPKLASKEELETLGLDYDYLKSLGDKWSRIMTLMYNGTIETSEDKQELINMLQFWSRFVVVGYPLDKAMFVVYLDIALKYLNIPKFDLYIENNELNLGITERAEGVFFDKVRESLEYKREMLIAEYPFKNKKQEV